MAEARQESDWSRTAHVMALIHNVNVSKKNDAVDGLHYNPFAPKPTPIPATIDAFRSFLPPDDPNRTPPKGGA